MTNDSKKPNNDDKNSSKKIPVSSHCKPCMPIERNGNTNKEKNGSVKNPSTNQTSNASSCYAKCAAPLAQQDSSSGSTCALKTTAKPSDQVSNVGSCYSKCGPPSVQTDSSTTANGSTTSTTGKPSVDSAAGSCQVKPLSITNPFIEKMEEDILYHIALGNKSHDLLNMFGDIKFVVMGSTPKRMEQFAYFMANQMKYELPPGTILNDISKNSHRYAMFKVGPVLSVSHGMGTPSIGILLHELIKLMSHAGIKDPTFVRIGTCGGFNKKAGTVVVSNKVVDDFMEPFYELAILGKKVRFPANLDQTVVNEILSLSEPGDQFETIAGATYCTDNFYEGSGRADGAICEYSETESLNYYKELQKNGVVNVEMESLAFAALTCRAGIKSAVITVILSDRLENDQIKQSKETLDEWQTRPQKLLAKYIKKKLSIGDLPGSSNTCGASSTTKMPASCNPTSGTATTTTCKSCGGTGSGADSYSALGTTSAKPTTSSCTSCGGTGKLTSESVAEKPSKVCTSSTLPPSDFSAGKTCGGLAKDNSPNTTTTSTSAAPSVSAACKSCGGTGKDAQTNAGSTTDSSFAVCKPCGGAGKIADASSTANKPSSSTCGSCRGTGKDTTTLAPMDGISSTSSMPSLCKSCLGSGKASDSTTPVAQSFVPTSSPDMVVCKCCGGAGVVKASSTAMPSSSVCQPCTKISNDEGQKVTSSSTSSASNVCKPCTPAKSSESSTTSAPSFVCKPCTGGSALAAGGGGQGSTTPAPSVGSSSVCKPCVGIGSTTMGSTTPAPGIGNSNVCKPCVGIGSTTSGSTTSAPSVGNTNVCKPCTGIGSTTPAPGLGISNVCKPCMGIGSSTTTSGSTTSAPFQGGYGGCKPCLSGSTTTTTKAPGGGVSADVCKPCLGSGTGVTTSTSTTTYKPANNATTTAQSVNKEAVCKPCVGSGSTSSTTAGGASTSKPAGSMAPASSQVNAKGVCKPCGGSLDSNSGSTTTSQPDVLTGGKCKQNEAGSTMDATGGTSTSKPSSCNTSSSQAELSTGGVCKPCGGGASTTTGAPASSTTTAQSGLSTEKSCKQNMGSTTPGASTCGIGSNTTTTTQAGAGTMSMETTTSQPSFSNEKQCKRNEASSTTSGPPTATGVTSICDRESFVDKICRRNSGGTMPTQMSRDLTTNTTPGVTTRTGADSTSVGACKPCSGGGSTVGPSSTTTTPASGLPGASSGTTSGTCGPNTTSTAPDAAASTTSRLSAECATSNEKSKATATASNGANTTERKRSKCVPYNCYTADKTDTTPLPTTPKAYLAKDFDSSSNSTISNDSWRSCYQKCSSKEPTSENPTLSTTYKPQTFQTPEQDNFKGVPPALGPCCAANGGGRSGPVEFREVPDAKGPCCSSFENEANSSNGQTSTTESTPVDRRKSLFEVKTESAPLERRKSFFQVKTESTQERRPSSSDLTTATPTTDQVVDSKLGPCCTGRGSDATMRPIPSNGNTLGPCCTGQSAMSQNMTTSRPTPNSQQSGSSPLCSGKALDDSPDEPCAGRKPSQETSNNQGADSKSNAPPGQVVGNIQGCPISIGGPCIYSKDIGQSQGKSADSCDPAVPNQQQPSTQNTTPKPSPDTPDTSVTRTMPAFVTPTPPSTKGIICCSKFINGGSVLVTVNKYDESPSPCATCKKFQEGKTRSTGSTPSDSQPEIIKCPHKLKRLKDECQGYD